MLRCGTRIWHEITSGGGTGPRGASLSCPGLLRESTPVARSQDWAAQAVYATSGMGVRGGAQMAVRCAECLHLCL